MWQFFLKILLNYKFISVVASCHEKICKGNTKFPFELEIYRKGPFQSRGFDIWDKQS